jgi:hypothetical protein
MPVLAIPAVFMGHQGPDLRKFLLLGGCHHSQVTRGGSDLPQVADPAVGDGCDSDVWKKSVQPPGPEFCFYTVYLTLTAGNCPYPRLVLAVKFMAQFRGSRVNLLPYKSQKLAGNSDSVAMGGT